MLGQRLRRCPNIKPTLGERLEMLDVMGEDRRVAGLPAAPRGCQPANLLLGVPFHSDASVYSIS